MANVMKKDKSLNSSPENIPKLISFTGRIKKESCELPVKEEINGHLEKSNNLDTVQQILKSLSPIFVIYAKKKFTKK